MKLCCIKHLNCSFNRKTCNLLFENFYTFASGPNVLLIYRNLSYEIVHNLLVNEQTFKMKPLSTHSKIKNKLHVTSTSIEDEIITQTWHMYPQKIFLADDVILEKSNRLQASLYNTIHTSKRTSVNFSRVLQSRFERHNNFR